MQLHWHNGRWVESLPPSTDVNPTQPAQKTIWRFKPNWLMCVLFVLAIPAGGFLLTASEPEKIPVLPIIEEAEDEDVEVIVDSIFRSIKQGEQIFMDEKRAIARKESGSKFKEWMWYLKAREGFMPKPYRCPAGYLTVGYGHNIDAHTWAKASKYLKNGQLTYKGATALLYDDIQEEVTKVSQMAPHLNRNQALAVASLFANCGSYKITGSSKKPTKFWKDVMAGRTPNFGVYCRYRSGSKIITAKNLVAARSFEQSLFEGCIKPVKIWDGRTMQEVSFTKAAAFYQKNVVMGHIVPAHAKGNFQ